MIRNDPKPAFRVINTKKVTQNSYIILITVREGQYRLRIAQQAINLQSTSRPTDWAYYVVGSVRKKWELETFPSFRKVPSAQTPTPQILNRLLLISCQNTHCVMCLCKRRAPILRIGSQMEPTTCFFKIFINTPTYRKYRYFCLKLVSFWTGFKTTFHASILA